MKCPLAYFANITGQGETHFAHVDCLQAECAWWSSDHERCAMAMATQQLYQLNKNLANITNLMPRGGAR